MDGRTFGLTNDDFTHLARVLYEEEDRMLPDLEGRTFADLSPGEIAHYRNCVTAVVDEIERLRIRRQ